MTTYAYPDAYLGRFITDALEERAIAAVGVLAGDATFSDPWIEQLVVTQAYILAALENQAAPDDLFSAKLKAYRNEMGVQLTQARIDAATTAETVGGYGLFGIPLERA